MQYSPDIALQILKAMESHDQDKLPMGANLLPDLDDEVYYFHCRLLSEAGYITVYEIPTQELNFYWPKQMTWGGVQFLQMFKDETFWNSTKEEARSKGLGTAMDILTKIGTELAVKMISP